MYDMVARVMERNALFYIIWEKDYVRYQKNILEYHMSIVDTCNTIKKYCYFVFS